MAACLVLIVVAFAAFAPGFATMPPMDRDEPRFAQASKQMLETGDFVSIRFQEEARLKKPVGIYWLQAACVSAAEALVGPAARTTIAFYRLPSLAAAVAGVLLTWWTALPLVGRRAAFLAGLMMAVSVLLGVEARLAKTDAALLATSLAMMGALARIWMRSRNGAGEARAGLAMPALFWTAAALSILLKGPVGPMIVLLTITCFVGATRDWRWLAKLRPLTGFALMLVLVSPWFIAIMIETGGRFLQQSVGEDMLSKVAGGQQSHGAPPATYFAVFWATFWPAAPLAALAAGPAWRNRGRPQIMFLLCWLIPSWIVFELVPTKLPHYVLPLYPALAMLIAAWIAGGGQVATAWGKAIVGLVPALALAVALVAPGAIWHYERTIAWAVLPFVIGGVILAVAAWRGYASGRMIDGLGLSAVAAILLYWGVYAAAMPALPTLWPSPRLATAARAMDCPDPGFATTGFREPSLVFLVSTKLKMTDAAGAADFLADGPCRMVFVDRSQEAAFEARLAGRGGKAALLTRVAGININGGRALDIGVYRTLP
jgi:4-amino-4-deoxy-L-arabinose transferase-like glycosyltransferase